jgi:hypothetical protein
MLLGVQRTKQISKRSLNAWMNGDASILAGEVGQRREEILTGALAEVFEEYVPFRDFLRQEKLLPSNVVDIGCGQGIPDALLAQDFECSFVLVDIEETDRQYHGWSSEGAGYASLEETGAFLAANGVSGDRIRLVNPRRTPEAIGRIKGDVVTSWISCGFHYPVDEYLEIFMPAIAAGGTVVLDVRNQYARRGSAGLQTLRANTEVIEIAHSEKSVRMAFVPRKQQP